MLNARLPVKSLITVAMSVLVVSSILFSVKRAPGQAAPMPSATLNPLFTSLLPALKSGTTAPVMLPAVVPFDTSTRGPLFARISTVTNTGYEVVFENTSDCNLLPICNDGAVLSVPASGPVDLSNYKSTKTVMLSNGISAIAGIPIYKQPTTITWDQLGQRYSIIFGVANYPKDLIEMANSMTGY